MVGSDGATGAKPIPPWISVGTVLGARDNLTLRDDRVIPTSVGAIGAPGGGVTRRSTQWLQ
jgi:hypothetical protein